MIGSDDEMAFLACIIKNPDVVYKTALTEKHFFNGQNRRIYRAMKICADKNITVDYISIGDVDFEIDKKYMVAISDRVPSGVNWAYYQNKIIEAYQRQKLNTLGKIITELSGEKTPAEVIELAEQELFEIGTNGQTRKITRMAEIMPETVTRIQKTAANGGKLPGLATGLPGLDIITGGLQTGRYVIIGARPSDGKSALALNMACNIAISQHVACGIISAESSNYEISMRALSSEGHIDGSKLAIGLLSRADMSGLVDASEKIKDAPLYLYDAPNIHFGELKSVARQMVAVYGVRCIFIDYVQIVQWEDKKQAFYEQVKNVSLGIKQLARELNIPIVALAQLRRDAEGREPEMADLGDSSQLEKDADALMFIYHKGQKKAGEESAQTTSRSFLLVKKNRDGARGNVDVEFVREYVKFKDLGRY